MKDTFAFKLKKYVDSDIYPFHMPGHKRNMPRFIKECLNNLIELDLTELEYTDDLHEPRGIIKESLDYARAVYNTRKTYFIVNGSTCAIHTALRTVEKKDKYILMASNAHFSAYNSINLNNLNVKYINVKRDEKYNIYLGADVEEIEKNIQNKDISAVYITSPTYEGVISDIEYISKLCHENNIILIVDEAHGAHLPFIDSKKSALAMGADIVIQSLHKTLPAFTQTALLHINSQRINLEKIEKNIRVFETSSPSYIFISSIDACIRYSKEYAGEDIKKYLENIREFRKNKYHNFEIFDIRNPDSGVKYLDETKLTICIKNNIIDANLLSKILRNEYKIEVEMSNKNYILAYTSFCDTREGFVRLSLALADIDKKIDISKLKEYQNIKEYDKVIEEKLNRLKDKILYNNIYIYPPGIPLIKSGDILDKAKYDEIYNYLILGYKIIFD